MPSTWRNVRPVDLKVKKVQNLDLFSISPFYRGLNSNLDSNFMRDKIKKSNHDTNSCRFSNLRTDAVYKDTFNENEKETCSQYYKSHVEISNSNFVTREIT